MYMFNIPWSSKINVMLKLLTDTCTYYGIKIDTSPAAFLVIKTIHTSYLQ